MFLVEMAGFLHYSQREGSWKTSTDNSSNTENIFWGGGGHENLYQFHNLYYSL